MSMQFAHFPYLKRIEDFDFTAQPSVDKRLIGELETLRFIDEGRNIIFLGPPGVGKTGDFSWSHSGRKRTKSLLYNCRRAGNKAGESIAREPSSGSDPEPDQAKAFGY